MDCRVNLMKKKSVRLVLVGMCGVAGLLVTPAMRAESSLGESAVTMSADEAEQDILWKDFGKRLGFGRKGIPIRVPNRSCITSIMEKTTWCRFPCGM